MKHTLTLVLLMTLIESCKTSEKFNSPFIDFLIKENYISKAESKEISNDSLFTDIYDVYLKRYNLNRGEAMRRYFTFTETETKTEKLINKTHDLKLIDTQTFNDLRRKFENRQKNSILSSEVISDELMLFQYLYEREKSRQNPDIITAYIIQLMKLNLIPSNSQIDKKLSLKSDIISLIGKKLIIKTDSLPESIEETYKFAFQALKDLNTSLKVLNCTFSIEDVQYKDLKYQSAVVRFESSGVTYISNNSYSKDYEKSDIYDKLDKHFFRIFNKVLVDRNSAYRIMDVERTDKTSICLILINNEQYQFLKEKENRVDFTYFDPEWYRIEVSKYWNPFDLLSQGETVKYFQIYDSIGLFSHLSEIQKEEELKRLKNTYLNSGESILHEVDNFCLGFDWEMSDDNKPYKTAIENFAAITHGEFTPKNIKDNFSFTKSNVNVSFDFRDKTYKTTVDVTGDWYSGVFLDLINKAIEENNLSGRFYDLPDGGQVSGHIYLTKNQYEFLVTNNLLRFYKEEN